MGEGRAFRYVVIVAVLAAGVGWTLASARTTRGYPGGGFLVSAKWLKAHLEDPGLVVVDVRTDKYFDGRVIPGAVRMPWKAFRYNDRARGVGGVFVGVERAQEILGQYGIGRENTVVLYDSVKRDGGATASYVFWILDLLGHRNVKILHRGIDAWVEAGGQVATEPARLDPVTYQAPSDEIRLRRWATGAFVRDRLGDPVYQILDVRSREEYLGEKLNQALGGGALKAGHIPTAYNVNYKLNWASKDTRALKAMGELLELYRGLDPARPVIVYCHSGRRGSFAYFVLRLMGFQDVMLYESSWYEWGNPDLFFPVELEERKLTGALPYPVKKAALKLPARGAAGRKAPAKGGYVSCGG